MPMFSFDKSSYESRLLELLQDKFFKTAQRNKIIAKWAAGRLGYTGESMEQYVRNVIFSYLTVPSDRKMIDRILTDFQKANIQISEDDIRDKVRSIEIRIKNKAEISENAS
ncbi:hypothetical protein FACS1894122_07130 [Alphaproteobacteria bacterium]|nr:hypothetical protein FACS1894122_07130 [Alphaproteobacteria bacterium]